MTRTTRHAQRHHDIAATSQPVGNYNILLDTFMHSTLGCEYGVRGQSAGNGGNGGNGGGRGGSGVGSGGGSLLTEEAEQGECVVMGSASSSVSSEVHRHLPLLLICLMYN